MFSSGSRTFSEGFERLKKEFFPNPSIELIVLKIINSVKFYEFEQNPHDFW